MSSLYKDNHHARHVVIACLAFFLGLPALLSAKVLVGAPFPVLENFSLDGALPETQGRVMVVDFWASWCAPCKASFPAYSRLQTELGSKVLIVGVSIDDTASPYRQFIKRLSPTFTVVRDQTQKLVATVDVPTMPTSYVIDRRGIVRFVHIGFHDDTAAKMRAELSQLLSESP